MDDDDCIGKVEGDDLEFYATVVLADPHQPGIGRRRRWDPFGFDGVDDVQCVGPPDAMTSRRAEPPQLPIHTLIVAQNSALNSG